MNINIVVSLALSLWLTLAAGSCPDGWIHHVSGCYHFSHDAETFPNSAESCKHMGGTITEIGSSAENIFIHSQAQLYRQNFWIGLTDIQVEGIWEWYISSTSLNSTGFSDWDRNQPDNKNSEEHCVYLSGGGKWADGPCRTAYHYICEKSDRASSSSIVG